MKYAQMKVNKTSAKCLASGIGVGQIHLRAMPDNPGTVFIGGLSVNADNGYPLLPGERIVFNGKRPDQIYLIGAVKDCVVAWMA